MTWREAFIAQARSDLAAMSQLSGTGTEYSHRLHYFQMATEKLAKGMLLSPHAREAPPMSHAAFVRLLRVVRSQSELRKALGFRDKVSFRHFVDSLLDLAGRVENLAPSAAGLSSPNPEYPWKGKGDDVIAPCSYSFPAFDPRDMKMQKLYRLVAALLRIAK